MKKIMFKLLLGCSIFGVLSCSIASDSTTKDSIVSNDDGIRVAESEKDFDKRQREKVTLFFIRDKNIQTSQGQVSQAPAVDVFINEDYLGSIWEGSYKSVKVCPQNYSVAVDYSSPNKFANRYNGRMYDIGLGGVAYLQLVDGKGGKPTIKYIDKDVAQKMMANTKNLVKDNHSTISRVDEKIPCVLPPVIKHYELNVKTLFAFNRSDKAGILQEGKDKIQEIASVINTNKANISLVKIAGYTDPSGSDAYNKLLSERRAKTIARLLGNRIQKNVADTGIEFQSLGYGEDGLLDADCSKKYPNNRIRRIACDQINRRVEITLYGIDE